MSKTLLVITTAGRVNWLEGAIDSLKDPLDILVVDDGSPDEIGIEEFCLVKGFSFIKKEKSKGLTDSWNRAYKFFEESNYENCILSNDDVLFPSGFSVGLIVGLRKFDLIGPLTNEPGSGVYQTIKGFIDFKAALVNINRVQVTLSLKYGNEPFFTFPFINGFCFAFSKGIKKFKFDKDNLFNPAIINLGNEDEFINRVNQRKGKIAICRASYVFHYKKGTYRDFKLESRDQLWDTKHSNSLNLVKIKDMSLEKYINRLKNNQHFSFVRFGDGEWLSLFRSFGKVSCDKQPLSIELQREMQKVLLEGSKLDIIFGMQNYALKLANKKINKFLFDNNLNIDWVNADIFHYACRDGKLFPLVEELRKQKVVVVGPKFLRKLSEKVFKYSSFIDVPIEDCYRDKERILTEILKINEKMGEDTVYSFSAGPLSKILITALKEKMPRTYLIDFGSLWDVFCGETERGYMKGMSNEILNKNLGE